MNPRSLQAYAGLLTTATLLLALAPPGAAFHGSWWKAVGTATGPDGTVYDAEYYWGGQDVITACPDGSCNGLGDAYLQITDDAGSRLRVAFESHEELGRVEQTSDPDFCPPTEFDPAPLQVLPEYRQRFVGGGLAGIMRNCLATGMNQNDFTGTFLALQLVLHSEGPTGVTHGG